MIQPLCYLKQKLFSVKLYVVIVLLPLKIDKVHKHDLNDLSSEFHSIAKLNLTAIGGINVYGTILGNSKLGEYAGILNTVGLNAALLKNEIDAANKSVGNNYNNYRKNCCDYTCVTNLLITHNIYPFTDAKYLSIIIITPGSKNVNNKWYLFLLVQHRKSGPIRYL